MVPNGNFRKTRLENGMRVVTEHVPHVRSVSLGIWVSVGSRDERTDEHGISHFLEHMVFKGTHKRDAFEIVYSLESLGGSIDAFSYRDSTCFYARCLDEHFDEALDVLGDILQNAQLDPKEIEKEKRVVLEEIQSVEDTPEDLVHDLFAKSVWGRHPVGEPILGTRESVSAFTPELLCDFMHRHYQPGRMIFCAAGNLDHDRFIDKLSEVFGTAVPDLSTLERARPELAHGHEQHHSRDIGQTHICLGAVGYAYTHPRTHELLVANTALGGGMSSRLFQEIRERLGLAYAVYSYLEMLEDTGLFGTYIACDQARVEQVVEIVRAELDRFRTEGISEKELESSKAQLRGELILGFESMDRRMSRMARDELYEGRLRTAEDVLARIDGVTQESMVEACKELAKEEHLHLVTLGP